MSAASLDVQFLATALPDAQARPAVSPDPLRWTQTARLIAEMLVFP